MMEVKKRDDLLHSLKAGRKQNLAGNISLLFWEIQSWTASKWAADGWNINQDQLKLIYLLSGGHALSNNELADLAGVTKQAMSQMVSTLEKRNVVAVAQNPADSRAKVISLSEYGLKFLDFLRSSTDELMKEYAKIIGDEKMRTLTEISMELTVGITKQKKM